MNKWIEEYPKLDGGWKSRSSPKGAASEITHWTHTGRRGLKSKDVIVQTVVFGREEFLPVHWSLTNQLFLHTSSYFQHPAVINTQQSIGAQGKVRFFPPLQNRQMDLRDLQGLDSVMFR